MVSLDCPLREHVSRLGLRVFVGMVSVFAVVVDRDTSPISIDVGAPG